MKKIFIASDHAGFNLKRYITHHYSKKIYFKDLGTFNSAKSVNYPDFAHKLCKKVSLNSKNIGILVCGTGMGMSMSANRHKKLGRPYVIQLKMLNYLDCITMRISLH